MAIELQRKYEECSPDVTLVQLFCPNCEEHDGLYEFWAGEHDGEILYKKPYSYPGYPRCLFEASLLGTESDEDVWRPKDELTCDWCEAALVGWEELE